MTKAPIPRLAGGLVELRPHRRQDLPTYHRWMCDEEVNALTLVDPAPRPMAKTRHLIQRWKDDSQTHSFAIHTLASKEIIGWCTLIEFSTIPRTADFSIRIAEKRYWGQGYGTEAAGLLLEYGFQELKYGKVVLNVFSFNKRAIACYRKLGFSVERVIEGQFHRGDQTWDNIEMFVTAEAFFKAWEVRRERLSPPTLQ